ncbi:MAG: xylulose kinase [Clostridia bacterium]|nr:MAG: xylulose kinase [Clostridia bacterium]
MPDQNPVNPLILSIDLGTTACKVGLVSPNGQIVAYVKEEDATPTLFGENGKAEQNPDDWWSVIIRNVRRLLKESGVIRERIVGVGVSAHWSGTVAVDESGKALGNALIWMDSRGAPYVDKITGGFPQIEGYNAQKLITWLRLTGGMPTHSGKDSLAHILYLKHEETERYKAAYKLLEPKDYINLRLTGKMASDYATITLYWMTDNRDVNHIHYHPKLLKWTDIDVLKLPELYPTLHILGPLLPEVAAEMGVPAGIPVSMGTPDMHAPALGSGAVNDFEPHVYVGTSSWLSCHVPFKKTDVFHNMGSIPAALPGRYFIANEQETAGVALTFLRNNLFFAHDDLPTGPAPSNAYALFDDLAKQAPVGSGGVIFTPWLYGERTPVEESTLRAGFYNLSLTTTRAEMVRSVLEGVAFNTRWLQQYVEKLAGRPLSPIKFIGGGALSDVWSQIFADVLQRPIQQIKDPQAAGLRGVGVLAGLTLKLTTLQDYAHHVEIANIYHPNQEAMPIYDELFNAFIAIYKQNSNLYKKLNSRNRECR